MTIQDCRNQEKTKLKTKIRNAAVEIINQDGYENLSIRKLLEKGIADLLLGGMLNRKCTHQPSK